jgi:uncharacterized membrane protein YadS
VAVVTKLVRNIFMALVIPLMAYLYSRGGGAVGGATPDAVAAGNTPAAAKTATAAGNAPAAANGRGTGNAPAADAPDASDARAGGNTPDASDLPPRRKLRIGKFFPLFILGFILFAVARSVGDLTLDQSGRAFGLLGADVWVSIYGAIRTWAVNFLVVALAGVGLSTRFRKLKELGYKPFLAGLGAAVVVGAVSYLLISVLGRFVTVV